MNDPSEASDNEQSYKSDPSQTNKVADEQPVNTSSKRLLRGWLLFALLIVLLVLLTVRDDLRQNAIESGENTVNYIAFELFGWSPRDLFIWRLRLAGLLDSPLGESMQTVIIFGAASGLGAAMVEYFHDQDFQVIAVARDPSKNPRLAELKLQSLRCDATIHSQVEQTISNLPKEAWVVSTMGSYRADVPVDYIGHRYLINALETHGIKRFLLVTSLGCGDSWQYLSERSKQGFGAAAREKSLAESWLQTSTLDYTILRPGGLKDGDITHTGQLSQHQEVHGLIHRKEVARLTHELLDTKQSLGQIYQCIDPKLSW